MRKLSGKGIIPPVFMCLVLCPLSLPLATAADASREDILGWIKTLGGEYSLDESGKVTGVDLSNAWLTDTDAEKLSLLPNLESINLAYTKITDRALEHLIPLPNVKNLNLYYAEYVTDAGIAHLKEWKNLEHLNVRGSKVTSTVFEHVLEMPKLKSLDVGFSRVSDELFEVLVGLDHLERFAFGGNEMSGVCLPLLKLLPSLRELDISGSQRTDSGLWRIALTDFNLDHIVQLGQLERLNIGETSITDRGVARLAEMKNLDTLDLHSTSVTARGIAALADADMPKLRRLRLWQAQGIDDSAVPHFLKMKNLEVLELQETSVTDAGLEQLAEMKGLKRLYVGASKVTPEKGEALRKSSPDRLISWWPKPKEIPSAESKDEEP